MFKLMHKKLNKKGFTLAELLVVVAVVAILVAIAVPIFTNSLKDAQIRTNEANIRSTKAAAVSQILAHWNDKVDSSKSVYYRDGAKKPLPSGDAPGWYAIGHVSKTGNLLNVDVYVDTEDHTLGKDAGITSSGSPSGSTNITVLDSSGALSPEYYTYVWIEPTDIIEPN